MTSTAGDTRLSEGLYRSMLRIRRVEEEIIRVYPTDKIKSPVHLAIGQEPVAVGVCAALEPQDVVFGTYRGHHVYLAKGGDLKALIAELYGKVTGCARGKGGSMHLIDVEHGVMGTSAVVATTIPHALGYAHAQKLWGTSRVTVSFFGDGAVDEGAFHESMNFAALRKLPVIFICENNGYAVHSPQASRQALVNIWERVALYGMHSELIVDHDVVHIRERVSEAAKRVRAGQGPVFLEVLTYRWREHVGPGLDFHLGYRTEVETRVWQERDELDRLGGLIDMTVRGRIDAEVEAEVREAFEFAEQSTFPKAEELYADLPQGV